MFLLLVLVRNPYVFLRSIPYLLLWRSFPRYLVRHASDVQEAVDHGLAGMPTGSPNGPRYAYTAAHAFARIELYRASRSVAIRGTVGRHIWRKLYGPVTPGDAALHELAAVVNKITGYDKISDPNVPIASQTLEQSALIPRYRRCLVGLLLGAVQGGTRGNESRIIVLSTLWITAELSAITYIYGLL